MSKDQPDSPDSRAPLPGATPYWDQVQLRRKAEKRVGKLEAGKIETLSADEARRLLHELQVQQIELEMQNEELRRVQAELEVALASMTDAVFISDVEGRFIHFNDAFAAFHRFKNKNECLQTLSEYPDILEVFTADGERAPLDRWAAPRALRGETRINEEYTIRRLDTGETWVGSYSFAPIRGPDGAIVGSVVVSRDITEQKQMEQQVRSLGHQLLKIQEAEKRKLSRELHDVIGQNLLALKLGIKNVLEPLSPQPPELQSRVKGLYEIIQQTVGDVRDMAHALRPSSLEKLGLVNACFQYCEEMGTRSGIAVDFSAFGIRESQLDYDSKINIYRIVQEGLNNIKNHSRATEATIRLISSFPDIIIRIDDNGKGFDSKKVFDLTVKEKNLGLISMKERVAMMQGKWGIESQPGKGTKIFIEIPFRAAAEGRPGKESGAVIP